MSIYNYLNNLQNQVNDLTSRNLVFAGDANIANALTASFISGTSAISGAIVYAGQLTGSAISGTLIYAGQLTGSAVSSSLIYAGQLTGSAISGTLIYAGRLTGSAVFISDGNLEIGTDGKGVRFPVSANSTASSGVTISSEILTYYIEVTWTPQISGSSTVGVTSYVSQVGRFTKIGRMVFLNVYVSWYGQTGAGNLLIGNLPFTVQNSDAESTNFLQYSSLTVPLSSIAFVQAVKNTAYLKVLSIATAGASSAALTVDPTASCAFSLAYEAA